MARDQKRTADFSHALCMLARERLTKRQKAAIVLAAREELTPSRLAELLHSRMGCSLSTAWDVIANLRRASLLEEGKGRGSPCRLTPAGRAVAEVLE